MLPCRALLSGLLGLSFRHRIIGMSQYLSPRLLFLPGSSRWPGPCTVGVLAVLRWCFALTSSPSVRAPERASRVLAASVSVCSPLTGAASGCYGIVPPRCPPKTSHEAEPISRFLPPANLLAPLFLAWVGCSMIHSFPGLLKPFSLLKRPHPVLWSCQYSSSTFCDPV